MGSPEARALLKTCAEKKPLLQFAPGGVGLVVEQVAAWVTSVETRIEQLQGVPAGVRALLDNEDTQ